MRGQEATIAADATRDHDKTVADARRQRDQCSASSVTAAEQTFDENDGKIRREREAEQKEREAQ